MEGTLRRARDVLRARDFGLLFGARLMTQFGDGLFQACLVASVVFAPEKQSTTVGFAKAVAILAVPYSVVGPFAGVFIDRWRRRRILVITPLLRALFALLILSGARRALPFYTGGLFVLSANRFFLTTAGAVIPRLVPGGDLLVANSISTVGGTVASLVGVVVGGQLSDLLGFRPVLGLTVAMWVLAPAVVVKIRSDLRPLRTRARGTLGQDLARVWRELGEGTRRLVRTPRALAPITSVALGQLVQGLVLVVSLVVFRERFREGVGSFSWLVAAGGVGVSLGLVTVAPLEARMGRRLLICLAFAVSGAPLVGAAFAIDRITVLVASFAVGVGFAWMKVPADTMAQEAIPDAFRGRVFAVYDMGNNMARVVAAVLAIGLLSNLTVTTVVAGSGALLLLWIPVIARWLRRAASLDVLMYAGSRADEVPRAIEIAGTQEPVEVERSWREERSGARLLCFRLRFADGSRVEVSKKEGEDRWRLDRELRA
jgi:MFS family permease